MVAYGLLANKLRYTFELMRRDCWNVSEYFSWFRLLSVGLFSLNILRPIFPTVNSEHPKCQSLFVALLSEEIAPSSCFPKCVDHLWWVFCALLES